MENDVPKEAPSPEVVVPVPQPQPVKKPFRLNKWHVVTVVLVVVICLQAFLYSSLTMSYNSLDSKHKALVSEHASLESDYGSLQSSYDSLEADYDSFEDDYAGLRRRVNQRALQFDVEDFVTPNDSRVKDKVLEITGGWSDLSDWDEYWGDVRKMYDWAVNNIEYRSDGLFPVLPSAPSGTLGYQAEMWQFPSETLGLEKGDCEDMAVLLTSMIRSYNDEKLSVECVQLGGFLGGHMGVQLPAAEDKLTILDPAGHYYTENWDGSLGSRDITAEINSWLDRWRLELGDNVHVDRVFSSYMDESFYSTTEYTTWMYNR